MKMWVILIIFFVGACGSDDPGTDPNKTSNDVNRSDEGDSSNNTDDSTSSPKPNPNTLSELHSPPESTKGFTACGDTDGETIYCIPGAYCDDARTAYCQAGCNSNSDCSAGTSCEDTGSVSHKACLPDSKPDTASDGSGNTYCGFRDGKVFTCNPGTYCEDPRTNKCDNGCLTELNCSEGEYCDYEQTTAFWNGDCQQGTSSSNNNTSDSICTYDDQNCCCLNGNYYSCPTASAVDACGGGDVGACLDECSPEDFDCQDGCFELEEPDPSECTRVESNDTVCD